MIYINKNIFYRIGFVESAQIISGLIFLIFCLLIGIDYDTTMNKIMPEMLNYVPFTFYTLLIFIYIIDLFNIIYYDFFMVRKNRKR